MTTTYADGPYFYRPYPTSRPLLCEIASYYVYFMDNEGRAKHLRNFTGTFTRLVEERPHVPHGIPEFVPPALGEGRD